MVAAEVLKFRSVVAAMSVQNEQPISTFRSRRSVLFKVLKPLKTNLISCPAIIAYSDLLVAWKARYTVLGGLVELSFEDNKGRKHLST